MNSKSIIFFYLFFEFVDKLNYFSIDGDNLSFSFIISDDDLTKKCIKINI